MNDASNVARKLLLQLRTLFCLLLVLPIGFIAMPTRASTQEPPPPNPNGAIVGDAESQPKPLPPNATPEERSRQAWSMLTDAAHDAKKTQTRIQALAALGLMRSPRSAKLIEDAMHDPELEVRTAAALAAGQTRDRNLVAPLRTLLDDKEPQVAFVAATTLWKMGDHSGEDILMAVVDGERSASPTMLHGTEHKISRDLHDPVMLARLGAIQGAYMLLGPFGYGLTAYEYIHRSGGDPSRAAAIDDLAQERTDPIHRELISALGDKDPTVRAAAAKALASFHDKATALAVFALLADPKQPVRLTAAAAYLRTTGIPGPANPPSPVKSATHPNPLMTHPLSPQATPSHSPLP